MKPDASVKWNRQELLSLLNRHGPTGPGVHGEPVWVRNAAGAWVEALDGRKLLDFSCGGVLPLGYDHPCTRQPGGQFPAGTDFEWPERVELERKLAEIVPGGTNRRVALCDSGREALARAVSLACRETGRKSVAYLAEVGSDRPGFGPDLAAVVVHPLDARVKYAAESCQKSGALLIDDETFLAPGITGRMFGIELAGIRPDAYVLGRGAAAGMPFGACVTGRSTLRWPDQGSGGSLAACIAALQYITLLEAGLLEAGRVLGARLAQSFAALAEESRVCRVVGVGLALGLRFDKPGQAAGFVQACRSEGLVLARMGDSTVGVSPPLVAGESELDFALTVMRKVLPGG